MKKKWRFRGQCYHCHTGRCPVGVATQDPTLRERLGPDKAAERVYNFLHTLTIECQMMARGLRQNQHSQFGTGRFGGTDHGGLGNGNGAFGRHPPHGRSSGHDPFLREVL